MTLPVPQFLYFLVAFATNAPNIPAVPICQVDPSTMNLNIPLEDFGNLGPKKVDRLLAGARLGTLTSADQKLLSTYILTNQAAFEAIDYMHLDTVDVATRRAHLCEDKLVKCQASQTSCPIQLEATTELLINSMYFNCQPQLSTASATSQIIWPESSPKEGEPIKAFVPIPENHKGWIKEVLNCAPGYRCLQMCVEKGRYVRCP